MYTKRAAVSCFLVNVSGEHLYPAPFTNAKPSSEGRLVDIAFREEHHPLGTEEATWVQEGIKNEGSVWQELRRSCWL